MKPVENDNFCVNFKTLNIKSLLDRNQSYQKITCRTWFLDSYNYPLDMSKFDNSIQLWMFEALEMAIIWCFNQRVDRDLQFMK